MTNYASAAALALAALLLIGAARVRAQEDPTKHIVFTETAGYTTAPHIVIASASGNYANIHPDPKGRYALILQMGSANGSYQSTSDGDAERRPTTLLLYDGVTGRTKTMWRDSIGKSALFGDIRWLSGADAALCEVVETSAPPPGQTIPSTSCSLLLIRPASTGLPARVVYTSDTLLSIRPSPTLAIAIISEFRSATDKEGHFTYSNRYFTVDGHGTVGGVMPLNPDASGAIFWSADGTTTYFREKVANAAQDNRAQSAEADAPLPIRSTTQWYSFNVKTQTLAPIDKRPQNVEPPKAIDANVLRLVSGVFTAVPPGAASQAPMAKLTQFKPLWLVRADGLHEGRLPTATAISPDAQENCLLADDSAVLYIAEHTVFVVPLTRQKRPDFDAAYRLLLKQQTISNAKQLGLALIGYTQDNDERFPEAGGGLAAALAPYMNDSSLFNNPETDTPGFTLLLGGQQQAQIADASHTILGYLYGPGGRAALMADGHVHWEDSP